ncbi:hypothetical protein C8A01DRAFT_34440 [Parachaetomium inaequale]|uniref:Uncharacterized protein n=1 Tax=Parachaetomium inaequale TaxID=2588326 RepID=A0AAN6PIW6_9PEZI|nr:hypothetical protein C8A01DRAFT_34440 [Parachaetomium inaequale]
MAESIDVSSGSQDGTLRATGSIIDMLNFFDKMDDLIVNSGKEVRDSYNPNAFLVSEGEFSLLAMAKRQYREADHSTEAIRAYLLRLPELDEIWGKICLGILRYLRYDPSRMGEWRFWLKQVERAGTLAWQKALNATKPIADTYEEDRLAMTNALIQKFAVVDEVLDEMHRDLNGVLERDVRFSAELDDSIQAVIAITRQVAQLTPEILQMFKAAIRM